MNMLTRARAMRQARQAAEAGASGAPLAPSAVLRGLRLSIVEGSLSNIHITVTGGALLTGFALLLGASDFELGLLAALPFVGQLFQPSATKPCTRARSFLAAQGVPYAVRPQAGGLRLVIGERTLDGFDEAQLRQVLLERGLPTAADPARVNAPMVVLMLFVLVLLATMVHGPMGAFLVEQFPTRVRYSGVSVALQFGNGWIGGFAPFIATAMVVDSGDIFMGLSYTIAVSALCLVVGALFIRDRRGRDMRDEDTGAAPAHGTGLASGSRAEAPGPTLPSCPDLPSPRR